MSAQLEPLILAIETATRAGSVSVVRDREILGSVEGDASASHSRDLIENIDRALRVAGKGLLEIDLYAAANGPGSFTGLRIGLATIKSLAVSTGRRCIGVSTLAAVARAAGESPRTVALLPAGRGEVFAQMFTVSRAEVEALDDPTHIRPEAMIEKYGRYENMKWAGEGAHLQLQTLRDEAAKRNIAFVPESDRSLNDTKPVWKLAPDQDRLSEAVGLIATDLYRASQLVAPEDLRAMYVRPSDAEIKKDEDTTGHKSQR